MSDASVRHWRSELFGRAKSVLEELDEGRYAAHTAVRHQRVAHSGHNSPLHLCLEVRMSDSPKSRSDRQQIGGFTLHASRGAAGEHRLDRGVELFDPILLSHDSVPRAIS